MIDGDPHEAGLIARVQQGDAAAYDLLVANHLRRVLAIAWSIVRNAHDAEDLAQEAFVRAYESIGRFRAGEAFGPWINRIVTNAALDALKHRKRVPREELTGAEPALRRDDANVPAMSREIGTRIDAALGALPEMQQIVARLHLLEDFDHSEIARMMSLSEGTVRSHLSLARKKLREQLADLYDD